MAGSRAPSGSLRSHASTASKVSKGGVFGTQPPVPQVKKNTFTNDDSDSDSDSSSSSSDSDGSDMNRVKQTPVSSKKADLAKSTPAKSPTVNGLKASIKKEQPSKNIKKENTSSSGSSESGSGSGGSSESGSESDGSSSDEKSKKAPAKVKEARQGTKPKPEPKTAPTSGSQSSYTSESTNEKAKNSAAKPDRKQETPSKSKAKVVKQATPSESESESESDSGSGSSSGEGSAESGSESASEGESDEESDDPEAQIQQQLKDDVKSAKATKSKASAPPSNAEPSNKKIKTSQPAVLQDVDGDIEMTDQSTALTNGGASTHVGSVPEFVAPDFHLRKLDGSIGASDVAAFFEKSKTEGKQIWYITAPASLPVTVVQDLTIPLDSAQQGLPVLSHNGDDYRLAFDDPAAASSFRLLIPNKKGIEYSELGRPVDQTMHFTRSETFIPDGPSSMTTTQTVSKTTRPARPQPEGLRARYTPLGVPASNKPLNPQASPEKNKSVANVAAQEAAAVSTPKSSSKKKRKHDGENGPVATPVTKELSKSVSAEKTAKKQKTGNRNDEHAAEGPTGRKETPVPLPPHLSVGSSPGTNFSRPRAASAVPPATQPHPVSKRSASPGARLPSTQLPPKQTPIPIPVPIKVSSAAGTPDAKVREGREKKNKPKTPSLDQVAARHSEMAAGRSPDKSENFPRKTAKASKKNKPILPSRHDSN